MSKFFKQMFCSHNQVRATPQIEMVLRDLDSYKEVSVFNEISFQCVECAKEGSVTLPVILSTKTSGSLVNKIVEEFISKCLGKTDVKVV